LALLLCEQYGFCAIIFVLFDQSFGILNTAILGWHAIKVGVYFGECWYDSFLSVNI
jgi:hypothetical protein